MGLITICNKIIEYSFYALFFLVPLIFTSRTSELFELNKMWITWGLAVAIISSWGIKMIAACEFRIQRTPLDIPILLFLISQIIATIFSLDQRISWWGYYSRFNGGLLSIITYILLYYAFITNLGKKRSDTITLYKPGIRTVSCSVGSTFAFWLRPNMSYVQRYL